MREFVPLSVKCVVCGDSGQVIPANWPVWYAVGGLAGITNVWPEWLF